MKRNSKGMKMCSLVIRLLEKVKGKGTLIMAMTMVNNVSLGPLQDNKHEGRGAVKKGCTEANDFYGDQFTFHEWVA